MTLESRRAGAPGASVADRAEAGKAARRAVPRSAHAEWEPAANRSDAVEVLERQATTRVPELVPLRYERMLVSPFTFYRGAAAVMAADLAPTPTSGIEVQLCGDAHLSNFGAFAAPNRDLLFDLNDFDETLPGPWEWDVKRLAASFAVAARDRGLEHQQRLTVVGSAAMAYRKAMRSFASMPNIDVWYQRLDSGEFKKQWRAEIDKAERSRFDRNVAKAQAKDRYRALSKLTHRVNGQLRIISDPPLIVPVEELGPADGERAEGALTEIIDSYRASLGHAQRRLFDGYRYVHTARKVVGVGSVGTRAWIALFIGRDDDDPLFLQVKEAEASVLEAHAGASEFVHPGRRVVEGQRLTQAESDVLLGWLTAVGPDGVSRTFYVRQLWDQKGSALVEEMSPRTLGVYAQVCGSTLARAHARSGDRIAIAAYLGKNSTFDEALAEFAEAYADQNERDFDSLRAAVAQGRVTAQEVPD